MGLKLQSSIGGSVELNAPATNSNYSVTMPAQSGTMMMAENYQPSFKNRIINGSMMIDQRNAGASYTATAGGLRYGVDRWLIYCIGANVTGQQVAGTNTGTTKAFRITGATGSTFLNFEQRIESVNTSDLASQVVTFKAKVWCSASISNASVYAVSPTVVDNYGGFTTSINTAITLNSGLNTIVVTGTLNSTANLGQAFGINFGSGIGNGVYVDIAEVQVEKGSTATSFDYRPYGTELALCQRYCHAYSSYSLGRARDGDTVYGGGVTLSPTMRTTPTLRSGASFTVNTGSAGTPQIYSAAGSASSPDNVYITAAVGGTWTTNATIALTGIFEAEL